jgi:hypothetical protein
MVITATRVPGEPQKPQALHRIAEIAQFLYRSRQPMLRPIGYGGEVL